MPAPTPPTLTNAFLYWLKLGFISFGGPAGQIALMHAELVEKRRWISERRFLHALNYCMLLPGPEATQLAVYIGWLMHGVAGGVIAGLLFVLPATLILVALSWIYVTWGSVPLIAAILYGIKPAVVAIVLAAAWRIGRRTLRNAWLVAIAMLALVAIAVLKLPFPLIVLAAGLAGVLGGWLRPAAFHLGGAQAETSAGDGAALIDDTTPTPPHARFSWARLWLVTVACVALGLLAWLALAWLTGAGSPLANMAVFFTKAAFLTFGGAYAVLPYVWQGAVEHYQWLSPQQMMDGLALGETTPGPLILVVAFVGYVGAWTKLGSTAMAIAGAAVSVFFTFLPSFLFILAGGPLVEATRGQLRFSAPLTAISAAVVGVIVSLALFFAMHLFHLSAPPAQWDWTAILLTAAACLALFRFRLGTIALIAASGLAGLVVSSLH